MQYNKHYFFKDIFIIVFGTHCILLGLLFFCDKGKFHHERFVINPDTLQTTVVFMPLQKRVPVASHAKSSGSSKKSERKVISIDEYEKKLAKKNKQSAQKKNLSKKNKAIKKVDVPKKEIQKAVVKKTKPLTTVTSEKKEHKKKIESSQKKVLASKKNEQKKSVKTEKLLKKKENLEDKKTVEKKITEVEKNIEEKKVVEEKPLDFKEEKILEDEIVALEKQDFIAQEPLSLEIEDIHDGIDLENVSFVGSLDLEKMRIKEQIDAEVTKYYKPPVGISKKAVCELSVLVGSDARAMQVIVQKSSGSIANDICARAAVLKVVFPKEVIGKEFIIELGQ